MGDRTLAGRSPWLRKTTDMLQSDIAALEARTTALLLDRDAGYNAEREQELAGLQRVVKHIRKILRARGEELAHGG